MRYWFENPFLKNLLPLALATAPRGLATPFMVPKIFFGANVLPEGPVIGPSVVDIFAMVCNSKRAFIVTDAFAERYAEKVSRVLARGGFSVETWNKAQLEAPLENVRHCGESMNQFEPDLLVAVGGGSAMDVAKAAWILYERPDITDLWGVNPLQSLGLRKKAFLAAVPTTSGTGSECTWAVVLTDTDEERKVPIANPELLPDFAILVPEFCISMPPELTAGTGLDALAHAMDAVIAPIANDFTDPIALRAIQMVFEYLPRVYKEGKDREARFRMHTAASMAGLAFSNSGVALTHTLGHALGNIFKMHHGVSVGLFIPYVFQFYAPVTDRYLSICRALGIQKGSREEDLSALVQKVRSLLQDLNVPLCLKDLPLPREDFERKLDKLVLNAIEDPNGIFSPRPITRSQCEILFRYAYEGRDVDF
jgi:alcohol dehydrogenase class IV